MDDSVAMPDPVEVLRLWLDEARQAVAEPHTMTLATASGDGAPSARIVLLRDVDDRGLTFFTNRASRKGHDLHANPRAALVLHWWALGRQVRVEGTVEELTPDESAAYWETRPRGSQIAAWASRQSQPLASRAALDACVADTAARFGDEPVPLPPFWGGYRVVPGSIEFWEHRDDRLHDRLRYVRDGGDWHAARLAP